MLMTPSHDGGVPPLHRFKWMAEHGYRLQELGYPLLPIAPGTKYPGLFDGMSWRGFTGWQGYAMAASVEGQVEEWSGWPGAGIGIPCGLIGGLDLDILDAEACLVAYELAGKALGPPLTYRVGLAPKRLIPYRMAEPFAKVKHGPMEFLALGQQFVAYGIHPDTQQPYRWPVEELSDIPFAELPIVTEQQVRAFMAAAYERLPPALRTKAPERDRSGEVYYARGGDQRGTWEATAAAVEHIPVGDDSHDAWIKLGLAIKGSVGDRGLELWDRWSRQSTKYKPGECARRWAMPSFTPRDVGFGHLFTRASEAGWQPPNGLIFSQERADQLAGLVEHRAQPWLDRIKAAQESNFDPETGEVIEGEIAVIEDTANLAAEFAPTPEQADMLKPGGLLQELMDWMLETSKRRHPVLAMQMATALVGLLSAHQYRLLHDGNDTRTNVLMVGLAESSSGKEHARQCAKEILTELGWLDFYGEKPASGQAVEAYFVKAAARIYMIDEYGDMMGEALDPSGNPNTKKIVDTFTRLATSASGAFKPADRAEAREHGKETPLTWEPCLTMAATGVEEPLWRALSSANIVNGGLARLIILRTSEAFPDRQKPKDWLGVRVKEMAGKCVHVLAGAHPERIGNWTAGTAAGALKAQYDEKFNRKTPTRPNPYSVPYSPAVDTLFDRLEDETLRLQRLHHSQGTHGIVGRMCEHIKRLALICAISERPHDPRIEVRHVRWAETVARASIATIIDAAHKHIADSDHQRKRNELYAAIEKLARPQEDEGDFRWVRVRDLGRVPGGRLLDGMQRSGMVNELLEMGLLERRVEKKGGNDVALIRPSTPD